MRLILAGAGLGQIMEEQFFLASKAHISISDSNNLPDFERERYVGLLVKELREKKKALDRIR